MLAQTLDSILDQTLKPREVIVVDDGSTDGTQILSRSFPPSVKYLQIENSGVCRARNVGVDLAAAPWVAYYDSDDLWHPQKLEAQARLLQAVPGLGYAFTNFSVVTNNVWSRDTKFDEAAPGYWNLPRRQVSPEAFVVDASLYERLIAFQPIFPSPMIMSRNFAQRVGPWVDALGRTLSEDLEFILRCVARPPSGVVSTDGRHPEARGRVVTRGSASRPTPRRISRLKGHTTFRMNSGYMCSSVPRRQVKPGGHFCSHRRFEQSSEYRLVTEGAGPGITALSFTAVWRAA